MESVLGQTYKFDLLVSYHAIFPYSEPILRFGRSNYCPFVCMATWTKRDTALYIKLWNLLLFWQLIKWHWRIQRKGTPGERPIAQQPPPPHHHPTGPNSFVFAEKHSHRRSSQRVWRPPPPKRDGKSWIRFWNALISEWK